MVVLIVANNPELSRIWSRHLERLGHEVSVVFSQAEAANYLRVRSVDVIVLSLDLEDGSAIAIADYASYRWPDARVVFVTNSTFFSDGSIFNHMDDPIATRHVTRACARSFLTR